MSSEKGPGVVRLKLSRKAALDDKYVPLLKRPKLKIEDQVLLSRDFEGTKRHLEALVRQINGTYQAMATALRYQL